MIEAESLKPYNLTRLGLALNYSVILEEFKENQSKAYEVAKEAVERSLEKISEIEGDDLKDAMAIIDML